MTKEKEYLKNITLTFENKFAFPLKAVLEKILKPQGKEWEFNFYEMTIKNSVSNSVYKN